MDTPNIQTRRLILRPLALSDAPAIQRHFNNWNIIKNMATVVPWPYPDDGAETFVKLQVKKLRPGKKPINGFWCCGPGMAKQSGISVSTLASTIQKAIADFGSRSPIGIKV